MSNAIKKNKIKVGWLLLGDKNVASSRIHGLNIHNFLRGEKGIDSRIIQCNPTMCHKLKLPFWKQLLLLVSGYDILIFQKVYDYKALRFVKLSKKCHVKTIFLQSDLIKTDIINLSDYVVVVSDYLRDFCRNKYDINAVVIEDAIEVSQTKFKRHSSKEDLEIVWVGHMDNWDTLEIVYKALEKVQDETFSLKTISNHPNATIKWNLKTVSKEILKSDIAVIPAFKNEWANAKSNNRLTMFMALGLPAIASSVPSYQKLIHNGDNGFIAEGIDDWVKYLLLLKDVNLRKKIGEKARKEVIEKYSIKRIGKQWVLLLWNIVSSTPGDIEGDQIS
jgi:hypothetical protein